MNQESRSHVELRYFLGDRPRQAYVCYFQPTFRNRPAVYVHVGMDWLSAKIGRTLERLGLRRRVVKLLRRLTYPGIKSP